MLNGEPIFYYCVLPIALAVGLFLVWCFAALLQRAETDSKVKELESKYNTSGQNRTTEKVLLIQALRTTPKHTTDYEYLNNRFKAWERIDNELSAKERRELVNMETVIDDRTQYELDNGINPYATEKQPRRVLKNKLVR